MPRSNHRNRVVVFRLTQEEYESLQNASLQKGARNLSDFTRSKVLGTGRSEPAGVIQGGFARIEQQLSMLQVGIQRLNQLLNQRNGLSPAQVSSHEAAENQDVRS